MRKLLIVILTFSLLTIILSVVSCNAPTDLNPPGDNFAGYVYFADSSFAFTDGFYAVSVYEDTIIAFNSKPIKSDSLSGIELIGYNYQARYKVYGIPPGKYFIAATWNKYPVQENDIPIILGTYGCDTNMTCSTHVKLVFPNFTGNYINIISWADTSKKMF
ncbi:MAG: hypothetical protein EHM58_08715 [Ignavibacteriae bacterium]|nr:MAG: hypothetical protein EHM58_08715 [Ignavibacteriota bacterium]